MKTNGTILSSLLVLTLVAVFAISGCGGAAGPSSQGPIVIGYVGQAASPGTKPCIDVQKMAVEEMNAAGGILGRPVKYVVEDGKGETSLSVAGVQRMVMGSHAVAYFVEGRTEIALATKQKSIELYKDFPHIMIGNGASGVDVTASVIDNYDTEKMIFDDYNSEPGHIAWANIIFSQSVVGGPNNPKGFSAKKWAILYENLAWTQLFRNGAPDYKLPSWDDYARKDFGIDVVYSKPIMARTGMYVPLLDAISKTGAEMIFVVSSWFTDTEVFTKQWADSPAKDIQIYLYGGVSQTHDFWQLTGGKALGAISASYETPITDYNMPLVTKARARGIPCQGNVLCAYDDIYHLKLAIETAGGTDDVGKIISAMETVQLDNGTLGPLKYQMAKVPGFFHNRLTADPQNPTQLLPGGMLTGGAQFQANGEMVPTYPAKYAQLDRYKTPAQLRAAGK